MAIMLIIVLFLYSVISHKENNVDNFKQKMKGYLLSTITTCEIKTFIKFYNESFGRKN